MPVSRRTCGRVLGWIVTGFGSDAAPEIRGACGRPPLTAEEDIPWRCRRLVTGTGADGALPVMRQVRDEIRRRKADLVVLPTAQAIGVPAQARAHTTAVLPLTC